ncbi:aminobenzoyl-glutamate utilization protein A [Amycolatopsis bartoniae]|uniref:Peptidase M20 n=1 Tax=Amycolatopsis bartoniae TaxID=941986 RepID=A0A8H9IQY8_9PSEU|nr:amidohydrolase [Amycolatopsis bartoniae]MBB2939520.1 aminobenzoyl-glutamate utilization protein A [Amycolatopsis bartoniae]TVT00334.1 amidohydrolase [Amycolatopsis bartoniae]GHF38891.1 peptidase M20 [Amycolatopsis bartoniae]
MDLITLRRDVHAHPEPAFCELRTAALVLSRLRELPVRVRTGALRLDGIPAYPDRATLDRFAGLAVESGADEADVTRLAAEGTAIVAELEGDRPGPTWALRFDMDALPVTEASDGGHFPAAQGFRSAYEGFMHACGHDGHVAIGLALAERLAGRDFPGTVRFLFQPAEEGGRGARAMLGADVVAGVDRFAAVHLGLDLPAGVVAAGITGIFATTKLRARFTGTASHAAAAPQDGRNALLAAATAVLGVHGLPRFSTADTRVNVGTLRADGNVNIVPALAELTCEARSKDGAVNADLTERVKQVLRGAALSQGVDVDIEETGGSTSLDCDGELLDAVLAAAEATGHEAVRLHEMGGSDDASLFAEAVQRSGGLATYIVVGGGNPAPHHNPRFDVDEVALPVAVDVLEALVRRGAAAPGR